MFSCSKSLLYLASFLKFVTLLRVCSVPKKAYYEKGRRWLMIFFYVFITLQSMIFTLLFQPPPWVRARAAPSSTTGRSSSRAGCTARTSSWSPWPSSASHWSRGRSSQQRNRHRGTITQPSYFYLETFNETKCTVLYLFGGQDQITNVVFKNEIGKKGPKTCMISCNLFTFSDL